MKTLFLAVGALADFTENALKYPVSNANIPDIGNHYRVQAGNQISIPLVIPDADESTYVVFAENYEVTKSIKEAQRACALSAENCDASLKTTASIVFKATATELSYAKPGFPAVGSDIASVDTENKKLIIENAKMSSGGFWWSVYGHYDRSDTNATDVPLSFKHDKMSLVQVVEECQIHAHWESEIDYSKFGWQKSGENLEFNDYGFAPGTEFAHCSFVSQPSTYLQWSSKQVNADGGQGYVDAYVPEGLLSDPFITCEMTDLVADWTADDCSEAMGESVTVVLKPPSIMDYGFSDLSVDKVFKYVNLNAEDIEPLSFSCPVLEDADSVQVVSHDFVSKNFANEDPSPVPMELSPEDLVLGGFEEGPIGEPRYTFVIRKENLTPGVHEFRCLYKAHEFLTLGYSSPFVLSIYEEDAKTAVDEPFAVWGETVKDTKLVKEGQHITNIANCYQHATGAPSGLQFGFRNQNGQEMLISFPEKPVQQHAISLNMRPIGAQHQADIFCRSSAQVGNETETKQVDLGTIEVIQKPYVLVLQATNVVNKEQWIIDCHAKISSHDNVEVALSLNKKFRKTITSDGFARFNITADFNEREQKKLAEKGTYCVYTSEQFPNEKFETSLWAIKHVIAIERGFKWGFLLMFGSLAVFVAMCFGFNENTTPPEDEESQPLKN